MKNYCIFTVSKQKRDNMKSFATKVVKFSQNVTPFGGISYVNAEFTNSGLS